MGSEVELRARWAGEVRRHLRESAAAKQRTAEECAEAVAAAAAMVLACLRSGGKLLLCGNGGSAADCQHLAAEFVSVLSQDFPRPGLPAIALTTDTSFLTASANDFGFDRVFARQVQALGRPGDALIGITTSGSSTNVVLALREARAAGLRTIALTGATGGKALEAAEITLRVPSGVVQHVQEAHIAIGHVLCELVERALFPEGGAL